MRHVRAAQPPGDGEGALEARGVGAVGGEQAREVVRQQRVGAVAGVERLVDRDRALEVAAALEQARLQEEQVGIVAGRGEAGGERRLGVLGPALAREQREERAVRLGQGGGPRRSARGRAPRPRRPRRARRGGRPASSVRAGWRGRLRARRRARSAPRRGRRRRHRPASAGPWRRRSRRSRRGRAASRASPRRGPGRRGWPSRARPPSRRRPGRPGRAAGPRPGRRARQSRRATWIWPSIASRSGSFGARRSASTTTPSAGPSRSSCIRKRA